MKIAKMTGISTARQNQIERSKRPVEAEDLALLAKAMLVSKAELLGEPTPERMAGLPSIHERALHYLLKRFQSQVACLDEQIAEMQSQKLSVEQGIARVRRDIEFGRRGPEDDFIERAYFSGDVADR